jgi:hypothetical protein
VLAIWLTYVGFGSIALWAFRFAWVQLGALGTLMSRALPLLMITVVVYFTGELWQLAARMTRQRLWQTIGFLAVVAIVFVITTIRDEVRTPLSLATGQRRRGHGGVTGDSGGVLHRRAIRVLPGTRQRRGARRCGRAVVRRRNLPGR